MTCGNTPAETLLRAADIGREAGLRFVYAGNLPGQVGDLENTYCADCHELLVERYGYLVVCYHVSPHGTCPACGASVRANGTQSSEASGHHGHSYR